MSAQRARVYEHRVTKHSHGWTIRVWVESDPAFGGVATPNEAWNLVTTRVRELFDNQQAWGLASSVCSHLLEDMPCANSVEVCDEDGNGCAAHRDWP